MLEVRIARSVGSLQLDVDLSVSSGTVLVAGPNGAGKTPSFTSSSAFSRPTRARILLDGRPLFDGRVDVPAERRRLATSAGLGAVSAPRRHGNVAFGLGHAAAERRDPRAWLTKLGVSDLARRRIAALSGGERQRVALHARWRASPARSCWMKRRVSLDPTSRRELRASVAGWLADWRLPALIVSHESSGCIGRGSHRGDGAGAHRAAGHGRQHGPRRFPISWPGSRQVRRPDPSAQGEAPACFGRGLFPMSLCVPTSRGPGSM